MENITSKMNAYKPMLYIFSFFYIFNPSNFFRFNALYILFLFSFLIFIFNKNILISVISKKRILFFFLTIILLSVYLLFFTAYKSTGALERVYSFVILMVSIITSIGMFVLYCRVYSTNMYAAIKFIVNLGAIQIFFVILSLVYPEFRNWILLTSRSEELYVISNDLGSGLRSFGLSSGYTSTFPMFMGLCSLFSLYLLKYTDKYLIKVKYFILILLFLLSVVLNARIGLVPLIIWLLFSPLFFFNIKNIKAFLLIIIFIFFAFPIISINFDIFNSDLFFRVRQGYNEITYLLSGKKTGTFSALNDMWIFPEYIFDLLFGQGVNTVGNYFVRSDIGIVQDIYMYGLVPTLSMMFFLSYFYFPLISKLFKLFGFVFILTVLISLLLFYFKGMILYSNEVVNLFLFLGLISLCSNKKYIQIKN